MSSAAAVAVAAKAGSIDAAVITLIEKGRERRESQGEDGRSSFGRQLCEEAGSPFRVTDLARGVVQLGQDVRHVDHSGRRSVGSDGTPSQDPHAGLGGRREGAALPSEQPAGRHVALKLELKSSSSRLWACRCRVPMPSLQSCC